MDNRAILFYFSKFHPAKDSSGSLGCQFSLKLEMELENKVLVFKSGNGKENSCNISIIR